MKVELSTVMSQPLESVFSHLADIENRTRWVTPAEARVKVTDGPVGLGTKFRSTDRLPTGRVTFDHEVTAFAENELLSEAWTGPLAGRSELRVSPEGEGTRVDVRMEMSPSGIYKILAPIARPLINAAMKKDLRRFEAWVAAESA